MEIKFDMNVTPVEMKMNTPKVEVVKNGGNNIKDGIGPGSSQTAECTHEEKQIFGAIAEGVQSVAFGGYRYDKNITDTRKTLIVSGNQAAGFGGSNLAHGNYTLVAGKDNKVYQEGSVAFGGGNVAGKAPEMDPVSGEYINNSNPLLTICASVFGADSSAIGAQSFAAGLRVHAKGTNSAVFGQSSTVSGYASFAAGSAISVVGECSFAAGNSHTVEGSFCTVGGQTNIIPGNWTTAFGSGNTTDSSTEFAFVAGRLNNLTNSPYAVVAGAKNTSTAQDAIIIGRSNKVTISGGITLGANNGVEGNYAVALGNHNSSRGYCATASGYHNTAIGAYTTVIGANNTAKMLHDIAIGANNSANGRYSVALGSYNMVDGYRSSVIGYGNSTTVNDQFICGRFTQTQPDSKSDAAFVVGYGPSKSKTELASNNLNDLIGYYCIHNGVKVKITADNLVDILNDSSVTEVYTHNTVFAALRDGRAKVYGEPIYDQDVVNLGYFNKHKGGEVYVHHICFLNTNNNNNNEKIYTDIITRTNEKFTINTLKTYLSKIDYFILSEHRGKVASGTVTINEELKIITHIATSDGKVYASYGHTKMDRIDITNWVFDDYVEAI